ncbi:hypothetical protein Anapl_06664 [Anas platyrhynchos]|uniref:Uncharacterized protein n=1 Tax=Anas platyrhynchos TaxID=8839 RepID=R0L131_ANAPL|nr:hypothetical protein Anapl_06664 [Anas platyrhynchos]
MGLCPKHPLLRAQRRQLPAMPRASPKILKEKAKRRNYVANPRYTLSCSSPLCYFAHFLQGRVGKLSANFTYAGSHRGPATWLCAVSMPLPRSPRAGCSVCPATTLFLMDIIIIRALFVCSGSEKEKNQQQVRWPYAGYSHLRHALPARCAKNNDSSEEKERKKGNEEGLVAPADARKSRELRIINWRGGESRGGGKLSSAGPRLFVEAGRTKPALAILPPFLLPAPPVLNSSFLPLSCPQVATGAPGSCSLRRQPPPKSPSLPEHTKGHWDGHHQCDEFPILRKTHNEEWNGTEKPRDFLLLPPSPASQGYSHSSPEPWRGGHEGKCLAARREKTSCGKKGVFTKAGLYTIKGIFKITNKGLMKFGSCRHQPYASDTHGAVGAVAAQLQLERGAAGTLIDEHEAAPRCPKPPGASSSLSSCRAPCIALPVANSSGEPLGGSDIVSVPLGFGREEPSQLTARLLPPPGSHILPQSIFTELQQLSECLRITFSTLQREKTSNFRLPGGDEGVIGDNFQAGSSQGGEMCRRRLTSLPHTRLTPQNEIFHALSKENNRSASGLARRGGEVTRGTRTEPYQRDHQQAREVPGPSFVSGWDYDRARGRRVPYVWLRPPQPPTFRGATSKHQRMTFCVWTRRSNPLPQDGAASEVSFAGKRGSMNNSHIFLQHEAELDDDGSPNASGQREGRASGVCCCPCFASKSPGRAAQPEPQRSQRVLGCAELLGSQEQRARVTASAPWSRRRAGTPRRYVSASGARSAAFSVEGDEEKHPKAGKCYELVLAANVKSCTKKEAQTLQKPSSTYRRGASSPVTINYHQQPPRSSSRCPSPAPQGLEIALRVKAAFVWLLAFPGETGQVSHGMRSAGTAVAGDWFPAEKCILWEQHTVLSEAKASFLLQYTCQQHRGSQHGPGKGAGRWGRGLGPGVLGFCTSKQISGSNFQRTRSPGGSEVKGMPLTAVFLRKQGSVSPSATKTSCWQHLHSPAGLVRCAQQQPRASPSTQAGPPKSHKGWGKIKIQTSKDQTSTSSGLRIRINHHKITWVSAPGTQLRPEGVNDEHGQRS